MRVPVKRLSLKPLGFLWIEGVVVDTNPDNATLDCI